jgi:hypothetical protein
MKANKIFIIIYHLTFTLLTVLCVAQFDRSTSYEMLSYAIWGNVLYIILGSIAWHYINKLVQRIWDMNYRILARFLLGLFFLYLLLFAAGGGSLLIVNLFKFNKDHDIFWISFAAHIIYVCSFSFASLSFKIKKLNNQS